MQWNICNKYGKDGQFYYFYRYHCTQWREELYLIEKIWTLNKLSINIKDFAILEQFWNSTKMQLAG